MMQIEPVATWYSNENGSTTGTIPPPTSHQDHPPIDHRLLVG